MYNNKPEDIVTYGSLLDKGLRSKAGAGPTVLSRDELEPFQIITCQSSGFPERPWSILLHSPVGDSDTSTSGRNLLVSIFNGDKVKEKKKKKGHQQPLFPLCPQSWSPWREKKCKDSEEREEEKWSLRAERTDRVSKRDKVTGDRGSVSSPESPAEWQLAGGLMDESAQRLWLRIRELFGLPIVPGLLFALHWRFSPASFPSRCHLPEHRREPKAAQWFHWRFMISEGLVADQRVAASPTPCSALDCLSRLQHNSG